MRDDLVSGVPDDAKRLLVAPPVTAKKLLELHVGWAELSPAQARLAEAVRLFVITWDPLEASAARPDGFAAINVEAPELAVYVPSWSLLRLAAERDDSVAAVLGTMAGSAVATAASHEESVMSGSYPRLVIAGVLPDLLSDVSAGAALGTPEIRLVSPGWDDIGLGAITDIVQHAFGPVDLDRSPVELTAASASHPGCRACAGRRFDFPADLAESRDMMCTTHRREAESVINRRMARANASNPDGWGALTDASLRLEHPHLPNGLATKLVGADGAMYVIGEPDELAERAELVVQAAGWSPVAPTIWPSRSGRIRTWRVSFLTGWSTWSSTSAAPAWGRGRPGW